MELSIELLAIIISTAILIIVISILEVRNKGPKGQEFRRISRELKEIVDDFKQSKKENKEKWYRKGNPRAFTEEDFGKINAVSEAYENIRNVEYPKLSQGAKVFIVKKSNKNIRKALIVMLIIAGFLFVNNYTILNILVVSLDLSIQFNLLFFFLNGVASVLIGAIFGYLLYRVPKLKRDTSEVTERLSAKEISRLKRLSKAFVGFLGPNKVKNKFYEGGVRERYRVLASFSKLLIAGFFGLSLYFVFLTVISIELMSPLDVIEIILSTFVFFSLLYYLVLMRKVSEQKFEYFSSFFLVLGITIFFNLLSFNWKWYYYLIILCSSIFLGISGILFNSVNKKVKKRANQRTRFIRENVENTVWINYLFIDLSMLVLYILSLNISSLKWRSFVFWAPIIYVILSTVSIILFIRRKVKNNIGEISRKQRVIIFMITLSASIFSVVIMWMAFEVIGLISLLFLASSSIIVIILYSADSEFFRSIKNLVKKKKKGN